MKLKSNNGRVVIAHFSPSKVIFICAASLAFIVLGAVMAYDMLLVHKSDDKIKYGLHVWGFAIAGVASIIWLVLMVRTVRAAVASHGDALWIEDGRLRHADKTVLDVATCDVTSVGLIRMVIYGEGGFWPPHGIFLTVGLRDGKEIKLSFGGFVENRDDVVVALREKLGLPAGDIVMQQGSM